MVAWLIAGGADARAQDTYGSTPTHRAAKAGHLDVLEYLRSHGAASDVHAQDRRGKTPQALACEGGHTNVSFFLHDHGAANGGQRVFIEK
jgi:ankyrin repeat protein